MSIISRISSIFSHTPESFKQKSLANAKMSLLQAQSDLEYHRYGAANANALIDMYADRIERLSEPENSDVSMAYNEWKLGEVK